MRMNSQRWLLGCIVMTTCTWLNVGQVGQVGYAGAEQTELGATLYQVACTACHGSSGTGDGPMRQELRIPPSDLTQLSRQNKGVFPEEKVAAFIDGRQEAKGHGTREMPIWGKLFEEPQDLHNIVEYLRTMQQPYAKKRP